MVSFRKPSFTYNFDFDKQIEILNQWKKKRKVPSSKTNCLTLCTWNIANLGLHKRMEDHYRLIAHILNWFDVIAVQEVHDNLEGLYKVGQYIGTEYELLFNDRGGNDERAAFFYNATIVDRLEMTGELAVPQKEQKHIKIKSVNSKFSGFDRNPMIASFQYKDFKFMLINAHSYFGSAKKKDMNRRILETYAIARYADLRRRDKHVYVPNIIALGDFNIPKAKKGDPVYDALVKRGLCLPEHSTKISSSISTDKDYDQIAFFPDIKRKIKSHGVFDYDTKLFPELWDNQTEKQFEAYCRYYISDHRPMWLELKV